MTTFSASELANMRTAQDGHMMDTAFIQDETETTNSYREVVFTYADRGTSTVCGLDMRPGSENVREDKTVLIYDATVRLPIGTLVDEKNRIKVTKRFGETLTTVLVYDIVGPVQRGPSGVRLLLRIARE